MKKKLMVLPLLAISTLSIFGNSVNAINSVNSKNSDNQLKNQNNSLSKESSENWGEKLVYEVRNINEWNNIDNDYKSRYSPYYPEDILIVFKTDVDFSKFDEKESSLALLGDNNNYDFHVEFDGGGHRLYDKNKSGSNGTTTPLIASANFNAGLSFHDFELDNMGTIFGTIGNRVKIHTEEGYDEYNSLSFDNITIENNKLNGEYKYNLTNKDKISNDIGYATSLFANQIYFKEEYVKSTSAVKFNNFTIKNNVIENASLNYQGESGEKKPNNISFSWLTSIYFNYCGQDKHVHESYIEEKNIVIENNSFINNRVSIENSKTNPEFSFGNLNGSFHGGENNKILTLDNILVQNNVIEKPINVNEKNFSYSELISQTNDISDKHKKVSFKEVIEVFTINNIVLNTYDPSRNYNDQRENFYNQSKKYAINLNDANATNENKINSSVNNVLFISPNEKKDNNLEIIPGVKTSSIGGNVIALDSLSKQNEISNQAEAIIRNHFDPYGYAPILYKNSDDNNDTNLWTFKNDFNESTIVISDLSFVKDKNEKITDIDISFKYVQVNKDTNKPKAPLKLSRFSLKDSGKVIAEENNVLSTSIKDNFEYKATLKMINPTSIEELVLKNLRITFNYDDGNFNSNKIVGSDEVKIVSGIVDGSVISDHHKKNGTWKIILIVLFSLILLGLLLFLLLFLLKRNKEPKIVYENAPEEFYYDYEPEEEVLNSEVQDGYYEFHQNPVYIEYDDGHHNSKENQ